MHTDTYVAFTRIGSRPRRRSDGSNNWKAKEWRPSSHTMWNGRMSMPIRPGFSAVGRRVVCELLGARELRAQLSPILHDASTFLNIESDRSLVGLRLTRGCPPNTMIALNPRTPQFCTMIGECGAPDARRINAISPPSPIRVSRTLPPAQRQPAEAAQHSPTPQPCNAQHEPRRYLQALVLFKTASISVGTE